MEPFYQTRLGEAYLGDALAVIRGLPDESVNLIVTSPPFPLTFQKKKPYGSVRIEEYVNWSRPVPGDAGVSRPARHLQETHPGERPWHPR